MSLPRGDGALTCLLAVLWVTAQGGAVLEEPPADLAGRNTCSISDTLDLVWTVVGRTVKSAVQSPLTELDSRLDSIQTRLESQLEGVQASLTSVQTEQTAHNTELASQLSRGQSALQTGLNNVQTRLQSELNSVQSELQSELSSVQTQLQSELSSVQTQLQSELSSVRSELLAATPPARDCSDLPAGATSGVNLLQPGLRQPVPAYCDLDTDGGNWTVIQRRADIQPRQDFFLGWEAYKWGLGELDAEFWWGLEHLWLTTALLDRRYQLRIDMEDFDGEKRYALYQNFRVSSEADGYRLAMVNYTGDAGDSLGDRSGTRFSTKDRDHDTHADSCAKLFKGAWWYNNCHASNLNGLYLSGEHSSYADGINWYTWRGHHYSLKTVEMKIRPSKKL